MASGFGFCGSGLWRGEGGSGDRRAAEPSLGTLHKDAAGLVACLPRLVMTSNTAPSTAKCRIFSAKGVQLSRRPPEGPDWARRRGVGLGRGLNCRRLVVSDRLAGLA